MAGVQLAAALVGGPQGPRLDGRPALIVTWSGRHDLQGDRRPPRPATVQGGLQAADGLDEQQVDPVLAGHQLVHPGELGVGEQLGPGRHGVPRSRPVAVQGAIVTRGSRRMRRTL